MFILDLNYKAPMYLIEKYLEEHRSYLDKYYSRSIFISSGPKFPRTGGVIIASCENKSELMKIIKEDPFYRNNLADYTVTEFKPNKGNLIDKSYA